MKKPTRIPLKLTRETLRQLDDERVRQVMGGLYSGFPTASRIAGGCTVTCGTTVC